MLFLVNAIHGIPNKLDMNKKWGPFEILLTWDNSFKFDGSQPTGLKKANFYSMPQQ